MFPITQAISSNRSTRYTFTLHESDAGQQQLRITDDPVSQVLRGRFSQWKAPPGITVCGTKKKTRLVCQSSTVLSVPHSK